MPKKHDNLWICDFGSRSTLTVGLNSKHVVVRVTEGGRPTETASIGFAPEVLHDLATRLMLLAETYDPALRQSRSIFLKAAE
jgi:hypothetical protein